MKIDKITVKGEKQTAAVVSTIPGFKLDSSYKISGANRDIQETHPIDLKDNDKLLEFVFDDGTTWMCDATTMHELFPEVEISKRGADNSFELPETISGTSTERGIFGNIALKLLNVFSKKNVIEGGIGKIADRLEDKLMVEGEGLFRLDKQFKLSAFDNKASEKPFLLFIHGTNSYTKGAFSQLAGTEVWNFIHNTYKENVLAFQHRTLTKSPLQNVVELVDQLPDAADLHIISHSRGGLVGDIICRYSLNSDNSIIGFVEDNISLLKKLGRQNDIDCIKSLNKSFLKKENTGYKIYQGCVSCCRNKIGVKKA